MMSSSQRKGKSTRTITGPNRSYERQKSLPHEKKNISDGVYVNPRFTHVATTLMGCVVKVQVKNQTVYEGILRTIGPKMEVVLELAHRRDDLISNNNQNSFMSQSPSQEQIIKKLIFKANDIICIEALNVDLDFAVKKDNFTDSAITNQQNGQAADKDKLRDLQPWMAEGDDEVTGLEFSENTSSSNGWDVNEMFNTNKEKFNYQSSYDENMSMYTTQLDRKETEEYRQREEEASRLANEIESTDTYKQRIALENGDETEEDKYSAVRRPAEKNNTEKYIPPNKRMGQNRNPRGLNTNSNHSHVPNRTSSGPHTQSTSSRAPHQAPSNEDVRLNSSKKEEKAIMSPSEPTAHKTVPVPELATPPKPDHASGPGSKVGMRRSSDLRDKTISELTTFKNNFNVNLDVTGKEKEKTDAPVREEVTPTKEEKVEEKAPEKPAEKADKKEDTPIKEEVKEEQDENEKVQKLVKSSNLNPAASEFFPGMRQQTSTPPRPQAQQSPILPMMHNPYHQIHSVIGGLQYFPYLPVQQTQQRPKRAVVSVQGTRSDLNAAAATGPPLVQSLPPYVIMNNPGTGPQPTGYSTGQRMPMPSTGTMPPQPPLTSVPMINTSHAGLDHSTPLSAAGTVFMTTPQGPVPAHIPSFHHHHTNMMPPNSQHHQPQGPQINPQVGANHPAASPVQQGPGGQGHPPSAGTPQPHSGYQQQVLQPHHPTSPQSLHQGLGGHYYHQQPHPSMHGAQPYHHSLPPNSGAPVMVVPAPLQQSSQGTAYQQGPGPSQMPPMGHAQPSLNYQQQLQNLNANNSPNIHTAQLSFVPHQANSQAGQPVHAYSAPQQQQQQQQPHMH